jgi:rhodanese-related sulfurtransferase
MQFKDTDKVLIYCQPGRRSLQACNKLYNNSTFEIFNLVGGINNWKRLSLPTVLYKKIFPIER